MSEGSQILLINGTRIISNYKIGNLYNDDTYFTFDPYINTSYLLYQTNGQLLATNNLTPTNTTFQQFNFKLHDIYFLDYIPEMNQLFVASNSILYSINPANISDILYCVNLTGKNGVETMAYSQSLDRLYIATGSTIQVINATTGSTAGIIRMGSQVYSPSTIAQIPDGNFLVTEGSWLYVINDKLNHLEPNYSYLEGSLILSAIIVGIATVTSFGILYFRNGKK